MDRLLPPRTALLWLALLALPPGVGADDGGTPGPASSVSPVLVVGPRYAPVPVPPKALTAVRLEKPKPIPTEVPPHVAPPRPTPVATATPASNIRPGFSVGLGWPYLGVKYFFSEEAGAELRYATGDNINVYAGRGYWSFFRQGNFSLLTGAELGYITFDSKTSDGRFTVDGDGFEISPFAGVEYFLDPHFSFLLDLSMPIIEVQSQHTSLSDLEWVVNSGVYFYPF